MIKDIANFDCVDIYREHGFLLRLSGRNAKSGREPRVHVFEVFGRPIGGGEMVSSPETILRSETSRIKWDIVSAEVRSEFNRRLRTEGKAPGRWGSEDTAIQRLLGKELLVLLWAIEPEDVSDEEIDIAVRNWLGLKPEERWWLYTMTAAATGLSHHIGVGWRKALRNALCFGTRVEAFHLGTVTGRGRLEPRALDADSAKKDSKPEKYRENRERESKSPVKSGLRL
jgi:hypothetical protein